MTFETTTNKLKFIVDIDIKRDGELNAALTQVLQEWQQELKDLPFDSNIEYKDLGMDEQVGITALQAWAKYKDDFKSNPNNHNTVIIVLENRGASASGAHYKNNGVHTGIVTVPKRRLEKASFSEKKDLIRHELAHAFDIPHVQGPFMVEGFYDGQATALSALFPDADIYEPNLDPISSDKANGFQEADKHHIRNFYPREIKDNIYIDITTDLKGMNLALIGRSRKAAFRDSVAQPSFKGKFEFYIKPGKYSMWLRPASQKGGKLSGVWKEDTEPSTQEEYWLRKKKGNKLIFKKALKKKHYNKKIKLNRDTIYELIIEN